MKKVFTLLMAMVIVMASFAQRDQVSNRLTPKIAKNGISTELAKKSHNVNSSKTGPSSLNMVRVLRA